MSRASSSHPRPSVPSQCNAEAGARRSSMSMSVGLGSGSTLASAARAKTKIIQPTAIQNSSPSLRVRATELTATSSSMRSSSVAMANPGIEDGVEQVDDKIDQHVAKRHEHHHALHTDYAARKNGPYHQSAHPRQPTH